MDEPPVGACGLPHGFTMLCPMRLLPVEMFTANERTRSIPSFGSVPRFHCIVPTGIFNRTPPLAVSEVAISEVFAGTLSNRETLLAEAAPTFLECSV